MLPLEPVPLKAAIAPRAPTKFKSPELFTFMLWPGALIVPAIVNVEATPEDGFTLHDWLLAVEIRTPELTVVLPELVTVKPLVPSVPLICNVPRLVAPDGWLNTKVALAAGVI